MDNYNYHEILMCARGIWLYVPRKIDQQRFITRDRVAFQNPAGTSAILLYSIDRSSFPSGGCAQSSPSS